MDNQKLSARLSALAEKARPPKCADFDEDCDDFPNKLGCYLYNPFRGYCPYLSASALQEKDL